ncbi:MAG: SDR family oxidoreductase [Fuerstiella sp.]|nr:SDR family oxidoreductase [Fuerstiella sp.]
MSCILLTGATGLLGRYMIRDLVLQGHSLAVLVRPGRTASATERIEEVMKHWEPTAGRLPTPKVLEGNITQPNLGLCEDDLKWASRNCSAIIHSAASLKFQPAGDEPWNSNLNGTRNVVELCEGIGIPQLFYISTAYVCGKVNSVAYETPVPGNTEPRNVYEASKRQAEQLVLSADLQMPPTILRPSIIVGDSKTGYTSTFHGPYLPLRLSMSLLTPAAESTGIRIAPDANRILKMMGLEGGERKNLVPVDWVSRGITRVINATELHGQIYHLTTEHPMSVLSLGMTTVEFLDEMYGFADTDVVEFDAQMEQFFTAQMAVYREYWSDDPDFDATNRTLAMPDDPPPVIDDAMLRNMFQYVWDYDQQQRAVPAG